MNLIVGSFTAYLPSGFVSGQGSHSITGTDYGIPGNLNFLGVRRSVAAFDRCEQNQVNRCCLGRDRTKR
jgi:hypothetical protein